MKKKNAAKVIQKFLLKQFDDANNNPNIARVTALGMSPKAESIRNTKNKKQPAPIIDRIMLILYK